MVLCCLNDGGISLVLFCLSSMCNKGRGCYKVPVIGLHGSQWKNKACAFIVAVSLTTSFTIRISIYTSDLLSDYTDIFLDSREDIQCNTYSLTMSELFPVTMNGWRLPVILIYQYINIETSRATAHGP